MSKDLLARRARELRNNPTEPEQRLWQALKGKQLEGFKFRRQQVIGWRIVDFYCPGAELAIEIDGDTHDAATDQKRDRRLLEERGIRVVRFTNEDVMRNLDGVLLSVIDALHQSNHPPTPSLSKEGEECAKVLSSLEERIKGGGREGL